MRSVRSVAESMHRHFFFNLLNRLVSEILLNVICFEGMRSTLPLADGEAERGAGPRGDLLCGRPELQRLRRVLALQDQ